MSEINSPAAMYVFSVDDERFYSEQDLEALGTCKARIYVQMFPAIADFAHLPLAERQVAIAAWSRATYERVTTVVPMTIIKRRRKQDYRSFTSELAAADVPRLLREPGITHKRLQAIAGAKPNEEKAVRTRSLPPWYAVQARFAIQVEDETTGMQAYEDRIVLVRAWNFDDAIERVKPEFAAYTRPYFNGNWQIVRWQFERILNVFQTNIKRFDPHGTEVYSAIKQRRMRPEYEWHPLQPAAPDPDTTP